MGLMSRIGELTKREAEITSGVAVSDWNIYSISLVNIKLQKYNHVRLCLVTFAPFEHKLIISTVLSGVCFRTVLHVVNQR